MTKGRTTSRGKAVVKVGIVMGAASLKELFDSKYYQNLE